METHEPAYVLYRLIIVLQHYFDLERGIEQFDDLSTLVYLAKKMDTHFSEKDLIEKSVEQLQQDLLIGARNKLQNQIDILKQAYKDQGFDPDGEFKK